MSKHSFVQFSDTIHIINGNPYITPPEDILQTIFKQAGKNKGTIPVHGTMNGAEFIQTLVRYDGDWRLYINGIMLRAAGIKFVDGNILAVVGTSVKIELAFDARSRQFPMHPDLEKALKNDAKASIAYEALAPYRKHEILRYLSFMKTRESTDKNITRILAHLRGEKVDKLHALMHTKK